MRTREGMATVHVEGRLRGRKPKLSEGQQKELRRMHDTGALALTADQAWSSVEAGVSIEVIRRQSIILDGAPAQQPAFGMTTDRHRSSHIRPFGLPLLQRNKKRTIALSRQVLPLGTARKGLHA